MVYCENTTLENIAPNVKQQFQNCQYSVDEIYFIQKVMLNILILYDVFHSRTRYYLVHELEDHILDAFPFHSHVSQPSIHVYCVLMLFRKLRK